MFTQRFKICKTIWFVLSMIVIGLLNLCSSGGGAEQATSNGEANIAITQFSLNNYVLIT